jgi:hypothetical protein
MRLRGRDRARREALTNQPLAAAHRQSVRRTYTEYRCQPTQLVAGKIHFAAAARNLKKKLTSFNAFVIRSFTDEDSD